MTHSFLGLISLLQDLPLCTRQVCTGLFLCRGSILDREQHLLHCSMIAVTGRHVVTQLALQGGGWTPHIEKDGAQLGVVVESGKHPSGCRGRAQLSAHTEQLSIRV